MDGWIIGRIDTLINFKLILSILFRSLMYSFNNSTLITINNYNNNYVVYTIRMLLMTKSHFLDIDGNYIIVGLHEDKVSVTTKYITKHSTIYLLIICFYYS